MSRTHTSDPDTTLLAGPYALYGYHGQIHKAAATEKSRYALNSVALVPEVPGLVATNGHMLAVLPLQPIDETGELGAFGTGFTKPTTRSPILLPLEVFKGMPKKLGGGETHHELVVVERDNQLYAIRRGCPYGNTHEYHIPEFLRDGQYPEYQNILESAEQATAKAKICFNAEYLVTIAQAIGAGKSNARVTFAGEKNAVLIQHATPNDDGPKGWAGAGIIMPITL